MGGAGGLPAQDGRKPGAPASTMLWVGGDWTGLRHNKQNKAPDSSRSPTHRADCHTKPSATELPSLRLSDSNPLRADFPPDSLHQSECGT